MRKALVVLSVLLLGIVIGCQKKEVTKPVAIKPAVVSSTPLVTITAPAVPEKPAVAAPAAPTTATVDLANKTVTVK